MTMELEKKEKSMEPTETETEADTSEEEEADNNQVVVNEWSEPKRYTFMFGDRQVETFVPAYYDAGDTAVTSWIRSILRIHHHRSRKNRLTVGVKVFRVPSSYPFNNGNDDRRSKSDPIPSPVGTLVLWPGGTATCMVIGVSIRYYSRRKLVPHLLRGFLNDPCIRFVGMGVKEAKRSMEREMGVGVGFGEAVEVRDLVERAFQRKGRPPLFWGVRKVGMEEMAEVALGVGVEKGRRDLVEETSRGGFELTVEEIMLAARDAFLAHEIGEMCFKIIEGRQTSSSSMVSS